MSRGLGGGVFTMVKQILVPLGDPSHYVTPNPNPELEICISPYTRNQWHY